MRAHTEYLTFNTRQRQQIIDITDKVEACRAAAKITSVQQVEQVVRIAKELGREVATGKEARDIYRIGETYDSAEETLARLGYAPNRQPGQLGFTFHA